MSYLSNMKTRPADALFVHRGPAHSESRPSVWKALGSSWRKLTTSEVVPLGSQPSTHDLGLPRRLTQDFQTNVAKNRRRSIVAIKLKYVSFKDAFGVLGLPMIVVALVCILWTAWLIVLTIAPNKTANYLMGTGGYDDGQFWLIPEELTALQILSVTGLSLMLSELLEAGTPVHLSFGFAIFTALNALFCAVEIISHRYTAFAEILFDSLFDLCTAVLFPIALLMYSAKSFDFDHAVFQINMDLLPVGSFERRARMFANPTEIERFRVSFDSLRIRTVSDFFLRIGMNIGFSYRFKRVVEVLIQMQSQRQNNEGMRKGSLAQQPSAMFEFPKFASSRRSCQKAAPKSVGVLFFAYSAGVIVITSKAISASQAVCSAHPECVVFAYRWRETDFCPCRALIDGNRAPKTYYEWTHPGDATNAVKALAAAGTLETLQVINRELAVMPDELQRCHLFSDMPELRYLQLGLHQRMVRLPPFEGVPNLACLVLARMGEFTELPSFKHLPRLQRLEFSVMKHLSWIPDLESAGSIVHFAVHQGAYLCCNGFLGVCDLTNPFCVSATCLEKSSLKATPTTLQVFEKFSANICQPYSGLSQTPTTAMIQTCGGIPFRQCRLPGIEAGTWVVGICYNHRMQVLACNPDPAKIKVRRRQIQLGVGIPCDPVEEAWLGCNNTPR
ncbi:unnamed protein product [Phytophthora lilii]|uniref:Unnamed protein product n=1 Tax=Phytophthora lilii TaxID=2077276 RepID=A0A9W6TVG9_9STRA|nr:unnamed protein product [Phytophthora lilii]